MNTEVKISVIMGIYNPSNAEELEQAVDSIIGQTFRGWEMILYDDGSLPEYAENIRKAVEKDSRIVYLREDGNHGLAYGLNRCIENAKGKYLARMDADDISKPERLERLYEFLEKHPEYQWVSSNSQFFDEDGIWANEWKKEVPKKTDFLSASPYIHPATMFRKEILQQIGGYTVSKDTMRCEDYDLFMRLHAAGYQGYNIQEPLLLYRESLRGLRKRKYKFRVREMKVRYRGFRLLGILDLTTIPYVIKPLIIGLIPVHISKYLRGMLRKNHYVAEQRKEQIGSI